MQKNLHDKNKNNKPMDNNIIEGNKLIAEFMGIKKDNVGDFYKFPYKRSVQFFLPVKMKYHSSWDWLMEIVEKMEHFEDTNSRGYSYHIVIFDKDCHIYEYMDDEELPIIEKEGRNKLEATWLAVVEFIKFYNQNKKS